MPRKNEVWFAGDYAGADFDNYSFYYGYERTVCPIHGNDADCECEDNRWAFVAKREDKEFDRFTIEEDLEPYEALAFGLAQLFSKWAVLL